MYGKSDNRIKTCITIYEIRTWLARWLTLDLYAFNVLCPDTNL